MVAKVPVGPWAYSYFTESWLEGNEPVSRAKRAAEQPEQAKLVYGWASHEAPVPLLYQTQQSQNESQEKIYSRHSVAWLWCPSRIRCSRK